MRKNISQNENQNEKKKRIPAFAGIRSIKSTKCIIVFCVAEFQPSFCFLKISLLI